MEDSGIESDSKSALFAADSTMNAVGAQSTEDKIAENIESVKTCSLNSEDNETDVVCFKGGYKPVKYSSTTSLLQKRLEKQILQAKKFRLREQSLEGLPKKLLPYNRLNVPKTQAPVVSKTDSHPLVSWESDSEDDLDYHPITKSSVKEISEQLLKDGYNLDLTPDDEDLDLIPPPKPVSQRCICCSVNCTCLIQ
ncbi:protein FAM219A [Parasteatoda tepidariorum]|uniref:protein FAM219A n=1 Tax=Parasteatoda tepidariorum TaxID=114398 RepID=UPI00077FAD67|nr:protein FAM219A [Parasteatoda tepidariorum]